MLLREAYADLIASSLGDCIFGGLCRAVCQVKSLVNRGVSNSMFIYFLTGQDPSNFNKLTKDCRV